MERKLSKKPEEFGHGAIEGVAGPEASNNAAATGLIFNLYLCPSSPLPKGNPVSEPGTATVHLFFKVPSDLRYTDLFHMVLTHLAKEVGIPEERMDWVTLSLREAINMANSSATAMNAGE